MKGILFVLAGGISWISVAGQSLNDTIKLREVEVNASFQVDNAGFKKVRIDSSILYPRRNTDLSTILSQYSTIFIKSYGNNSLSTPTFRGTSAHHTLVEWNGINITSPMLGQTDLSQIPVSQFEGIEILYGAAGIARSSGAFGGIINVTTSPDWNNRIQVSLAQSFASFNIYTTSLVAATGNQNFQSHTKANFSCGKNDFPFYNDYTQSVMRQINGSFLQYGISEDIFVKIRNRHVLSAKIWYNYTDRNIPPPNTTIDSTHMENQTDKSLRSMVEYKLIGHSYHLGITSALIDQFMHYINDSLDANHQYYSWINRVRFSYTGITKFSVKPGIDFTYDWVRSDGYAEKQRRYILGGFLEIKYEPWKTLTLTLLAREDLIDGTFMPFIPALGLEYKPFKKINLSFSGNLARNYRYPTLNDLYWDVYGNPDLLPELSYSAEASIIWNYVSSGRAFFMETELSGYYSYIEDMIEWIPVSSGGAIWKPVNITEVLARGVEAGVNASILIKRLVVEFNGAYNFCKSTYQKVKSPGDASLGKQLKYTPVHTLNATLRASYRNYYLSYTFNYTSRRYTGNDNQTYMPGYNLSNIFFGKNFLLHKFILSLQVEINNLFNLDYQSIANRPMPGRNFALTVRGSFTDKPGL